MLVSNNTRIRFFVFTKKAEIIKQYNRATTVFDKLLNRIPTVKVSDTTGDASSTSARYILLFFCIFFNGGGYYVAEEFYGFHGLRVRQGANTHLRQKAGVAKEAVLV